jgi:streptomycin 6-kinase
MSGIPHISAHAAEQLKPVLDDVLTTIRQCLESAVGDEDADGVVNEVVRAARRSVAERSNNATLTRRSTQEHLPRLVSTDDDDCSTRLAAAIETLCHMPAPAEVSRALDKDRSLRASAEHAAGWLQALIHLMPN